MVARSFQELIMWQKSRELTVAIYKSFGECKDYGFRDQIQRASVSIMNNVAEGYAKQSSKAFKNYLLIAKGSSAEVESMLILALDLGYIDETQFDELTNKSIEVSKILTGFMRKLKS